ncbi:MAG: DUF6320 domain-containing protein, partial [Clostridia bacterium]
MYCKYCNINVETSYPICPICKNKLEGTPLDVSVFPERKPRKLRAPVTFTGIYFFVAVAIIAICVSINIYRPARYIWSLMVAVLLLYIFLLIKHSIMYKGTGGSKIFVQTLTLSGLVIVIQYLFHMKEWAFSYGLPSIVLCSLGINILFVSIFNKKSRDYVRYMTYTTLIGFIPAILELCGVFEYSILSASAAIASALV